MISDDGIYKYAGVELSERELRDILSFVFEWIDRQLKTSEIRKWEKETQEMLVEVILEPPKWFVKARAVGNSTFDSIHYLVKKSFKDRKIQSDLRQLFAKHKKESLHHIEQLVEAYEVRTFGSKKANELRTLRMMPNMKKKLQIVERYARQAAQNRPNRYKILRDHDRLLLAKAWVKSRTFPFAEKDFDIRVNGEDRILEISYKIWKPDFVYPLYMFEDQYQSFPLKWLGFKVTVWVYENLYQRWKEGKDLTRELESFYDNKEATKTILAKCRSNHIGFRRASLLREIIENYEDQRYASVVTMALTQVEGVIWDMAIVLHNIGVEKIFDKGKIGFNEHRGSKLLDENGKLIDAEPSVGLIVTSTRMKKYLYAPFLEYCTNELFRERHPILHGRVINFGTRLEANKKLLALEMVFSTLHDALVDNGGVYLRHILRKDFKRFMKSLRDGNSKEAFTLLKTIMRRRAKKSAPIAT